MLDGMGAEARQAPRAQSAPARRHRYQLLRPARGSLGTQVRPLRDHARYGHPVAAGGWPRDGRHAVAPAQPAALRRPGTAGDRGLRHPPAAGRGQRGQRESQPVFTNLFGPRRHRPVHDRGVGRLPGPVPRGQLRRQGHLRRRRVRDVARRPRSGEHAAQPRPLRRLVRARGAVYRHPRHRRLPVPLSELRRAAAPLGPRRLADRALDLADRAR